MKTIFGSKKISKFHIYNVTTLCIISKVVICRERTGHLICKISRFRNFNFLSRLITLLDLNRIVRQAIHLFFLCRSQVLNAKFTFLTLSGPAFSVVRQARGGSEAQMPKIKVNINQLKLNLA